MKDEKYTMHLTEKELDFILTTFDELTRKHLRKWLEIAERDGKTEETTKQWRITNIHADIRDKAEKLLKGQSK